MAVSFSEILKDLEEYDLQQNQTPPIIIEGGEKYPIDLSQKRKLNYQLILVCHEILTDDESHMADRYAQGISERLGQKALAFTIGNSIQEVTDLINEFSQHFGTQLNVDKIVQPIKHKAQHEKSVFHLFIVVLKTPYYL